MSFDPQFLADQQAAWAKQGYVLSPVPPVAPAPVPPAPSPAPVPVPQPTFVDDFSTGQLDTSKWIPSNWGAPGGGAFSPTRIDLSQGCLRIRLTQTKNPDGSVSSIGGELQSKPTFGYGTYEWIIRASSTSPTPSGSGQAVSGQISSAFIYNQTGGYTEIDCPEIEGQFPNTLEYTSYTSPTVNEETSAAFPNPEAGFHSYKTIWSPGKVQHFYDGQLIATQMAHVPSMPAYAMINHWGTNSKNFGGLATPGVNRFLFVKRFSFTPA